MKAGKPEHDPEKWTPVSRLREAPASVRRSFDASAGDGRSEKIMLSQKAKAKWRLNVRSFRFGVGLTRCADLFNPKARILADHWR
jgi:hypothetical protein